MARMKGRKARAKRAMRKSAKGAAAAGGKKKVTIVGLPSPSLGGSAGGPGKDASAGGTGDAAGTGRPELRKGARRAASDVLAEIATENTLLATPFASIVGPADVVAAFSALADAHVSELVPKTSPLAAQDADGNELPRLPHPPAPLELDANAPVVPPFVAFAKARAAVVAARTAVIERAAFRSLPASLADALGAVYSNALIGLSSHAAPLRADAEVLASAIERVAAAADAADPTATVTAVVRNGPSHPLKLGLGAIFALLRDTHASAPALVASALDAVMSLLDAILPGDLADADDSAYLDDLDATLHAVLATALADADPAAAAPTAAKATAALLSLALARASSASLAALAAVFLTAAPATLAAFAATPIPLSRSSAAIVASLGPRPLPAHAHPVASAQAPAPVPTPDALTTLVTPTATYTVSLDGTLTTTASAAVREDVFAGAAWVNLALSADATQLYALSSLTDPGLVTVLDPESLETTTLFVPDLPLSPPYQSLPLASVALTPPTLTALYASPTAATAVVKTYTLGPDLPLLDVTPAPAAVAAASSLKGAVISVVGPRAWDPEDAVDGVARPTARLFAPPRTASAAGPPMATAALPGLFLVADARGVVHAVGSDECLGGVFRSGTLVRYPPLGSIAVAGFEVSLPSEAANKERFLFATTPDSVTYAFGTIDKRVQVSGVKLASAALAKPTSPNATVLLPLLRPIFASEAESFDVASPLAPPAAASSSSADAADADADATVPDVLDSHLTPILTAAVATTCDATYLLDTDGRVWVTSSAVTDSDAPRLVDGDALVGVVDVATCATALYALAPSRTAVVVTKHTAIDSMASPEYVTLDLGALLDSDETVVSLVSASHAALVVTSDGRVVPLVPDDVLPPLDVAPVTSAARLAERTSVALIHANGTVTVVSLTDATGSPPTVVDATLAVTTVDAATFAVAGVSPGELTLLSAGALVEPVIPATLLRAIAPSEQAEAVPVAAPASLATLGSLAATVSAALAASTEAADAQNSAMRAAEEELKDLAGVIDGTDIDLSAVDVTIGLAVAFPSRFSNNYSGWGIQPCEAVAFALDGPRPVVLAGMAMYGGEGAYTFRYEVEMLSTGRVVATGTGAYTQKGTLPVMYDFAETIIISPNVKYAVSLYLKALTPTSAHSYGSGQTTVHAIAIGDAMYSIAFSAHGDAQNGTSISQGQLPYFAFAPVTITEGTNSDPDAARLPPLVPHPAGADVAMVLDTLDALVASGAPADETSRALVAFAAAAPAVDAQRLCSLVHALDDEAAFVAAYPVMFPTWKARVTAVAVLLAALPTAHQWFDRHARTLMQMPEYEIHLAEASVAELSLESLDGLLPPDVAELYTQLTAEQLPGLGGGHGGSTSSRKGKEEAEDVGVGTLVGPGSFGRLLSAAAASDAASVSAVVRSLVVPAAVGMYNYVLASKPVVATAAGPGIVATMTRFPANGPSWGFGGRDAVQMKASEDIQLVAVSLIFGVGAYSGNFEVMDEDSGGVTWSQEGIQFECATQNEPCEPIYLDPPFNMDADVLYTFATTVHGSSGNRGLTGKAEVEGDDGVVFNIVASRHSYNGTSVEYGQLPVLHYRRLRAVCAVEEAEEVDEAAAAAAAEAQAKYDDLVAAFAAAAAAAIASSTDAEVVGVYAALLSALPKESLAPHAPAIMDAALAASLVNMNTPEASDRVRMPPAITVESPHPYAAAQVNVTKVAVGAEASGAIVAFSPRCATLQAGDTVQIFADEALTIPITAKLWGSMGGGVDDGHWPAAPVVVPASTFYVAMATVNAPAAVPPGASPFGYACTVQPIVFGHTAVEEVVMLAASAAASAFAPLPDTLDPAAVALVTDNSIFAEGLRTGYGATSGMEAYLDGNRLTAWLEAEFGDEPTAYETSLVRLVRTLFAIHVLHQGLLGYATAAATLDLGVYAPVGEENAPPMLAALRSLFTTTTERVRKFDQRGFMTMGKAADEPEPEPEPAAEPEPEPAAEPAAKPAEPAKSPEDEVADDLAFFGIGYMSDDDEDFADVFATLLSTKAGAAEREDAVAKGAGSSSGSKWSSSKKKKGAGGSVVLTVEKVDAMVVQAELLLALNSPLAAAEYDVAVTPRPRSGRTSAHSAGGSGGGGFAAALDAALGSATAGASGEPTKPPASSGAGASSAAKVARKEKKGGAGASDGTAPKAKKKRPTLQVKTDVGGGVGSNTSTTPTPTSARGAAAVFDAPREVLQAVDMAVFESVCELVLEKTWDADAVRKVLEASGAAAAARVAALNVFDRLLVDANAERALAIVLWSLASAFFRLPAPHYLSGLAGAPRSDVEALRHTAHAVLASVAAILAPTSTASTAIKRLAVACWRIELVKEDHPQLQETGIFRILRELMHAGGAAGGAASGSDAEGGRKGKEEVDDDDDDDDNTDAAPAAARPSTSLLSNIVDRAVVEAEENNGMAGTLTDGTVDTFWFGGKTGGTVTVSFPKPVYVAAVSVAVSTADKGSMPKHFSLATGVHKDFLEPTDCSVEVPRAAVLKASSPSPVSWVTLPVDDVVGAIAVRMSGSDARLRSLVVLGVDDDDDGEKGAGSGDGGEKDGAGAALARDALGVFELLTAQVFGGIGGSSGKSSKGTVSASLREELVGMVFVGSGAGGGVSELQRGVLDVLVGELARVATEREALPWAELTGTARVAYEADVFAYQLVSMVHALSGSDDGLAFVGGGKGVVASLCSLLFTGTPRVQRTAGAVLKRVLGAESPLVVADDALVTLLLTAVAKTLSITLRGGRNVAFDSVFAATEPGLVGEELRELMVELAVLADTQASRVSAAGSRALLALAAQQSESLTDLVRARSTWTALAALSVVAERSKAAVEALGGEVRNVLAAAAAAAAEAEGATSVVGATCANHDDGKTLAASVCATCGPLCAMCDPVLHLSQSARAHVREPIVDDAAFGLEFREGAVRMKMSQLKVVFDLGRGNALLRAEVAAATSGHSCRFCGEALTDANEDVSVARSPALQAVCTAELCQERKKKACAEVHEACGHACGGVDGESEHLPCLECGDESVTQDHEDMCNVCWTDPLGMAPSIRLTSCGHVFHAECLERMIGAGWNGARIMFNFIDCPLCKVRMESPLLDAVLEPLVALEAAVKQKANMRAGIMRLAEDEDEVAKHGSVEAYALHRLCYYKCSKCAKPYYGGDARCEAAGGGGVVNPDELVCGACRAGGAGVTCAIHGDDYLSAKCRYCCSVAVWFCHGSTSYCDECHSNISTVQAAVASASPPRCPVGPRCVQLPDGPCPLGISHPDVGNEFSVGCGLCRDMASY